MRPEDFLIVGCQRTGTTLMRLVLECHSQVSCLDEGRAYLALASGDRPSPADKARVGFKVPRWTEQLAEERLSDYRFDVEADRFYDRQPVLFMLRDVRDTVASMATLKAGRRSWLEVWGIPTVDWKIERSREFRDRFSAEIRLLEASRRPRMIYAALYWKYKSVSYLDYMARGWPVLGVRYEDLVRAPEPELRRVADFLGLPWEPGLLDHPRSPHGEILPSGNAIGGTHPGRSIDTASLGRWKGFLEPESMDQVLLIAGDLNREILGEGDLR